MSLSIFLVILACNPSDICSRLNALRSYLDHVYDWFSSNRLRVNTDKTVVFLCGSKRILSRIDFSHIEILGHNLPVLSSVKLLGVTFDSTLTFNEHISRLRWKCFFQIRNLYRVSNYVSMHCLARLIDCFVLTHIDYCNSLFASCKVQ